MCLFTKFCPFEFQETVLFFENHYSHIFYIVYDAFVAAELGLRQKGPHKAQREELEAVLYLLEKVGFHHLFRFIFP